jgi:hypothetical protein
MSRDTVWGWRLYRTGGDQLRHGQRHARRAGQRAGDGFAGRFRKLREIVGLVMLDAVKVRGSNRTSTPPALETRADETGQRWADVQCIDRQ